MKLKNVVAKGLIALMACGMLTACSVSKPSDSSASSAVAESKETASSENTDTENMLETEQSEGEVFKATLRHLTPLGVARGLESVQDWEVERSQIVTPNGN